MVQPRFATEKQFALLKARRLRGTLGSIPRAADILLTETQARDLGFESVGDFILKSTKAKDIPTEIPAVTEIPSAIEPAPLEEITPIAEAIDLPTLLRDVFPEKFDPRASFGFTQEELVGVVQQQINDLIETDPEGFLRDLVQRGRNENTENLLRMIGLEDEEIDRAFEFGAIPEEGQFFRFVTEEDGVPRQRSGLLKPDSVIYSLTTEEPLGVIDFSTGVFKSVHDIRRDMVPSESEINRILNIGGVPQEEIDKIVELSEFDLTQEGWLEEYLELNPSFNEHFNLQVFSGSVTAGIGDILQAGGGVAGWAKQDTLRDNMMAAGERLIQQSVLDPVPYTTLGDTIANPMFWLTTATRTTTLSVVAMIPVALGAAAALPVAGAIGLGSTATTIFVLLFGSAAGALPEAALESGGAYNEALAQGFSREEASKAAGSVYWKNAGLLFGANAVGFGLPFLKVGGKTFTGLVAKGWAKPVIVGGKVVGTSLTEGGQEFVQEVITKSALGQEVKWDEETKLAVFLGTFLGGTMGGGLIVFDTIISRTKVQFTPEQLVEFENRKAEFIELGFVEEGAEIRAMDFMVENNEDVKTNLEENVEQVNKEELIKQLDPEDRAEALAIEHVSEKEGLAPTPTVEPVARPELVERVGAEVTELDPSSESFIKAAIKQGIEENSLRQGAKVLATLDGEAIPRNHHVAEASQYLSPGIQERLEQAVLEDPESLNAKETLSRFRAVMEVIPTQPPVTPEVVIEETKRDVGAFEVMTDKDGRTIFCG